MRHENINLTTDGMQATGKHFMGANKMDWDVDPEAVKRAQKQAELDQLAYVDRLMEKDKDCKSFENKTILPIGCRIVIKPYEKNPYRIPLQQSTSGLIIGDFDTYATQKSQDTGEQEAAQRGIWCCEVIAIGPECKHVQKGDDVYVNFQMASPLPFGGKGFYSINETNVICSIR